MLQPRLEYVTCPHPQGKHRLAYWVWGPVTACHVIVCVHGLTRQGRDFDRLARGLIDQSDGQVKVVCPDVAGRGRSDWLPSAVMYQIPQYAADMLVLLNALHTQSPLEKLDWVGTSMGGLIGMALAGQAGLPLPVPIRRLVLNDVGPAITWSSVERMQQFVGLFGQYADLPEAAKWLREVSAGFGPVPDDVWLAMSSHMLRDLPQGGVTLHYDPTIGQAVRSLTQEQAQAGEAAMWAIYDQIQADTLLIRGRDSDLLMPETARAMSERGPRARCVEWEGVGHAPTLTTSEQIEEVANFLLG